MNIPYLFLIIFFLKKKFSFVSAEGLPRTSDKNDRKIIFAHIKQQLELRCPIENERTRTFVDWHKGNVSLYGEKGYTITRKGDLKIKSVKKEHEGLFTCEGINGYGFVRINITVVVYDHEHENKKDTFLHHNSINRENGYPPVIKKHPLARTVLDIGGSVAFHCVASGNPPPKIFFFKNENFISNIENIISSGITHATYRIHALAKSDGASYKCIARNKLGEDEVDFVLHITDPVYPPEIPSLEPSSVTIKEGQVAVFWCEIKSKPDIRFHIKWLKQLNRKEIERFLKKSDASLLRFNNNYYRLLNSSEKIGEYKSRFSISNANKEDSGIYVCLAINDNGYKVKNATLTVIRTVSQLSPSSAYFSVQNVYLVASIATTALILVVLIGILCYCLKLQKKIPTNDVTRKVDAPNLNPISTKVKIEPYAQTEDLQSNTTLLCGNKTHNFEKKQYHISKTIRKP